MLSTRTNHLPEAGGGWGAAPDFGPCPLRDALHAAAQKSGAAGCRLTLDGTR